MTQARAAGFLPEPTERIALCMRDNVRLDTYVWRTQGSGPFQPAILIRTPYSRAVTKVNEPPLLRYLEHGYAVVVQQIRGVGASEGSFSFCAEHEKTDGYDTVEWIAAQSWCSGAVGMDGHSYAGMMQLYAAAARPPHLRCIAPAVVSVDPFAEPPYIGGAFSRLHTLVWSKSLQFSEHLDESGGAFSFANFLADPEVFRRWTSRPLIDAADGELTGDFLQHYRDVLAHPTLDDWWRQRILQPHDYAAMDLPMLVVSGIFDPSVGTLKLWRALEEQAAGAANRFLLIGPWDHNGSFNGGVTNRVVHGLNDEDDIDLVGLRIQFFDQYLKVKGPRFAPEKRLKLFISGQKKWLDMDAFPAMSANVQKMFLHSSGHANSSSGDGALSALEPAAGAHADHFTDDPAWPFYGPISGSRGPDYMLDMYERTRHHDTLVYTSEVLTSALTIVGEAVLDLFVAIDTADADICAWMAERRANGRTIMLAFGQIRLRYHKGFEQECELQPGVAARVSVPLTYVAHQLTPGSALCLLLSGSNFPLLDPNPHVAGPIATAASALKTTQTVFHDADRPSCLLLPVLGTDSSGKRAGRN